MCSITLQVCRSAKLCMYQCEVCQFRTESLKSYTEHFKVHRNLPNFSYPCGVANCGRRFLRYSSLKSHTHRDHAAQRRYLHQLKYKELKENVTCEVNNCGRDFKDLKHFLAHLRAHIEAGTEIECPVRDCDRKYSVKGSFTSHLSRCHQNWPKDFVGNATADEENFDENLPQLADHSDLLDDDSEEEQEPLYVEDNFLDNLALFYLKFQAKYILPSSTIQAIIEEYQSIHEIEQTSNFQRIRGKLVEFGLHDDEIEIIQTELLSHNLLKVCTNEISGPLRTEVTRKTFYKKNFSFVEPDEIYLGKNSNNTKCYLQYVPICESLKSLFSQTVVREQHTALLQEAHVDHVFHDVTDGKAFKENDLFKDATNSINILLYQDAFEIVNPLGSAKTKHKILGVYFTLGNFFPYNRSNIDHMQLVLLCKDKDFQEFGQQKVFAQLISDLKTLEQEGISVGLDSNLRGTVGAIIGDNLGSHCIGGFTENFSVSHHFCRYCIIDRQSFYDDPLAIGQKRSIENYNEALIRLQQERRECMINGIKCDSVFNHLQYFHVCQGLPPCLGHDLFEGLVSYDLSLIIQYFVEDKRWLTYDLLNRDIAVFKYLGNDACNKPNRIKSGDKIGGHAVQNWCLVRLFPLLVGRRIQDFSDKVWNLLLLLRKVTELVCAPKISEDQVCYLDALIQEYLQLRSELFENQLKPKHHYLRHYPRLIIEFGPLIRLWTLRFESKHSYFKRCIKSSHNFKNPCLTLANSHQFLQAYLSAGSLFPPVIKLSDTASPFFANSYCEGIENAVEDFQFSPEDTVETFHVTYKGSDYRKGTYVVIARDEEGELLFGRIITILCRNNELFFLTENYISAFVPELSLYAIEDCTCRGQFQCVNVDQLLDYYPLVGYSWKSNTRLRYLRRRILIPLHHDIYEQG